MKLEYKEEEKKSFSGEKVKILGPTFEEGKPDLPGRWRGKLRDRQEMLSYLENGERYWFGKEWYGSERRKTPA